MSIINELGEHNINLPKILNSYETELKNAEEDLTITGKNLEKANVENPRLQYYYDYRRTQLSTLVKYFEIEVAKVRSTLFRSYTETFNRDLSDRAKEKYMDNEPAYLIAKEFLLEVKEIHDLFVSIVDAFKIRGYALNNAVKLRCAALEEVSV